MRAVAVLVLLTVAAATAAAGNKRYAYATIHYEGTPADDEYILGIRVLMRSLQPLQHPFLILVSDNVSERSRRLFEAEGATIVPVPNVDNPFGKTVLKRFLFTFNKLHLWNLVDYDRIIYFDADNIAVHRDAVDDMFGCGHFCVVYMNPCHFHTGVMVVRPDPDLHQKMVHDLKETGSFDGADQGFLSAFFGAGGVEAPFYNPANGISDEPMNRLHIGYNVHSLYYLSRKNYDQYRCGPFAKYEGDYPVATIGFPVAPLLKPWYWYNYYVGHAGLWHEIRSTLDEPEIAPRFAMRLALLVAILVGAYRFSRPFLSTEHNYRWATVLRERLGASGAAALLGVVCMFIAHRLACLSTPLIMRPHYATILFITADVGFVVIFARFVGNVVFQHVMTDKDEIVPLSKLARLTLPFLCGLCASVTEAVMVFFVGYSPAVQIFNLLAFVAWIIVTQFNIFLKLASTSPALVSLKH